MACSAFFVFLQMMLIQHVVSYATKDLTQSDHDSKTDDLEILENSKSNPKMTTALMSLADKEDEEEDRVIIGNVSIEIKILEEILEALETEFIIEESGGRFERAPVTSSPNEFPSLIIPSVYTRTPVTIPVAIVSSVGVPCVGPPSVGLPYVGSRSWDESCQFGEVATEGVPFAGVVPASGKVTIAATFGGCEPVNYHPIIPVPYARSTIMPASSDDNLYQNGFYYHNFFPFWSQFSGYVPAYGTVTISDTYCPYSPLNYKNGRPYSMTPSTFQEYEDIPYLTGSVYPSEEYTVERDSVPFSGVVPAHGKVTVVGRF